MSPIIEGYYGVRLTVLATMEGDREKEAEIHARFAHLRFDKTAKVGGKPEQFKPTRELLAFLGLPLLVTPDPDAVEVIPMNGNRQGTMVRSRKEWKAGIEAFADWDRAPSVSDLIDRAVAAYARERGYEKPIPKR